MRSTPVLASLLSLASVSAFVPQQAPFHTTSKLRNNAGPPLNWTSGQSATPPSQPAAPQPPQPEASSSDSDEETLRGNRFSKYAPDTSLPKEEFREQLKENMKRDLERRRAADPNRGNQPAKNYLDNL